MSLVKRIVDRGEAPEQGRRRYDSRGREAVLLALHEHGFTRAAARRFVSGPIATVVKAAAEYRQRLQRQNVSQASAYEVAVLAEGESGAMVGQLEYGQGPGRVTVPSHVRYAEEHPGVYVTAHVHPNDYPVTPADLRSFLGAPWLRSLVVLEGKNTWYILSVGAQGERPNAGEVAATYTNLEASPSLARVRDAAVAAGFGSRSAKMVAHHILLTRVTTIYGLQYNEVRG